MSRSVNYADNAKFVKFMELDLTYNDVEDSDAMDNLMEWLLAELSSKFKSLDSSPTRWANRETIALCENYLAIFWVSEYCGCVSLSVTHNNYLDPFDENLNIAEHWIEQIENKLDTILQECPYGNFLRRVGTFSNGSSVYEKV